MDSPSWGFWGGPGTAAYRLFDALRAWVNNRLVSWLTTQAGLDPKAERIRILEAGSGPAGGSSAFRRRFPDGTIVALDIDADALGEGRRRDPDLAVVVGDIHRLPFADGVFDLVWNSSTLEHLPAIEPAIAEMARVAAPEGYVFVGVPYRWGALAFQPLVRPTALGRWLGDVWSTSDLSRRLQAASLSITGERLYFIRFFTGVLGQKSDERRHANRPQPLNALGSAVLLLSIFSLVLVATMGNHHFFADDWAVLAYGSGFDWARGIAQFGWNLLRPVEGIFWITEFKLFGFDRPLVHAVSLALNICACGLFGIALRRTFPRHTELAGAAAITAFFLPMLSSTTFIMYIDNSRLSVLLYWLGVIVLQSWASRSRSNSRLALGTMLLLASLLTYENTAFLIFVVPLFLLPLLETGQTVALAKSFKTIVASNRCALMRLGIALVATLTVFLFARYVVFGGGVHRIAYPWPSAESLLSYLTALGEYLAFAVLLPTDAPLDWIAGGLVVGATWWCLGQASHTEDRSRKATPAFQTRAYIAGVAAIVTVAGFAPYMLIFSDAATIVLHGGGRYFSSAAYGLALFLALVVTAPHPLLRHVGRAVLAGYVGLNAAFFLGISHRWEEAADVHCTLWNGLLDRAPMAADNTAFLFLDLETTHRGATVIAEPAGTRFLLPFLYGHRRWEDLDKVTGYHLSAFERELPPTSERRLTVKADGLMVRGRNPTQPIDPSRLVLVRRDGDRMIVLDRIASDDRLISANWLDGIGEVRTNRSLILPAPPNSPSIEDRLAALSIKCR